MTMRNAFENLATESGQEGQQVTLDTLAMLLAAIIEKMPRVDVADRVLVSHAESNPAVTISSGTVTTCATLSNQTNIGGRDASHAAFALANIGTAHIYNNIVVS